MNNLPPIRASKELWDIINFIKAKYYLAGKTPPSVRKITEIIARRTPKEKLYHEEFFIKF